MKTASYIFILILTLALPVQMRSQQVLVNVGNERADSVTVTVTVKMPRASVTDSTATIATTAIGNAVTGTGAIAPVATVADINAAIDGADSVSAVADTIGGIESVIADAVIPDAATALDTVATVTTPELPYIDRHKHPVVRKNTLGDNRPEMQELVIVRGDTVHMVIPTKNYGRFDRGLFNYLYIVKGSWQFGLSASYGEFNTDDVQVLSMLKDVDFSGKLYSIKPWVSYCFRNNQTMGLRLNYTRGKADLANLAVDIDDDMNFELHDVSYYSQSYSLGIFYRNYVGLNRSKRFAVFNEVSLDFSSGSSRFKRYYNDELSDTRTVTRGGSLNFSPGVCVFIQENAAFNVSFGVFGLKFNKETQTTNGVDEGSRFSSGANFKFNIFNINLGLMVVI